jgi:hypothetical protein
MKPNELSDEAKPNKLNWSPGPGCEAEAIGDAGLTPEAGQTPPGAPQPGLQAEIEREAEEFGLTHVDPIALYGPNGEAVASMLDELPSLDRDRAERIADAWEAVPAKERQVSQMIVRRLRQQREFDSWLRAAQGPIDDWLAARESADPDETEMYASAADAMRDAVAALALDDELADDDFAILYGAWSEVMDEGAEGEDEEGEYEEEPEEEPNEEPEAEEEEEEEEPEEPEDEGELEYGPNTDLVLELLDRLARLDTAKVTALTNAWKAQPPISLRKAHEALQALAREDPRWWAQIHDAQTAVSTWAQRRFATETANRRETLEQATSRRDALPAAVDAVSALVMADMLETEEAATLYAPWAQVVGKPALPAYDESLDEVEPDEGEPDQPA